MNTGKIGFNTLTEIYVDTGLPTGNSKPNLPTDPDYIAPVVDNLNCPPILDPLPLQNKILVIVKNSTSQSMKLMSFLVKPQSGAQPYFTQNPIQLFPGASIVSTAVDQSDPSTFTQFKVEALSHNIRVKAEVSYRKSTEVGFTSLFTQNLMPGEDLGQIFSTGLVNNSDQINDLMFEFTDNPVPVPPPNVPPIVDAGKVAMSTTLPDDFITLSGTATDPDGFIVSHVWTQISGPNTANIVSPNSLTTVANGLIVGTYVFQLTGTDNSGASSFDTIQIVVAAPQPSLYGDVNVYVGGGMPDNTFEITSMKLIDPVTLAATELLSAHQNKSHGVQIYHPLKGTYKLEITVSGAIANDKGLYLQWNNGLVQISVALPQPDTYAFENVVVDEGVNGVIVNYTPAAPASPSFPIRFVKLTADAGVWNGFNTLPFGLIEQLQGNVSAKFYDGPDTTTAAPTAFTGELNGKKVVTDNISVGSSYYVIFNFTMNNADTQVVATVQAEAYWDYTLNDPMVAESADHVFDYTYAYQLLSGQGYLIIP